MSRCTQWADVTTLECKAWATDIAQQCTDWADEGSAQCSDWADEGSSECSSWEDQGHSECSSWADEGHNECCDWAPCSWFCDAFYWVAEWVCHGWYWVANLVCQAWYWVAKWVCKAWYWVAKWVCKAVMWVIRVFCTFWNWIVKTVCIVWTTIVCTFNTIAGFFLRAPRRPRVQHLFVLMLENRSFDHMLGFAGIKGTDARTGAPTQINGVDGTQSNFDPVNGTQFFVTPSADFKLSDQEKDPPHEFDNTVVSLAGNGAAYVAGSPYPPIDNSGFVANAANNGSSAPDKVMNCFNRQQLPVLTALAEEFAVCDNWYSSMPGPTWPNRFFVHAATSGGLDDSPSGFEVVVATGLDGYRFANGTIFDSLEDRCLDWQIFEGDEMPQVFAISGMNLYALMGRFTDFDEFAEEVGRKSYNKVYTFIEPNYGNVLPVISAADFTCGNSQHPLDDVTRGEKLIKDVYEALRMSPIWEKSALIVTYDEHGGFYDHAAPGAAVPPGDPVVDPANVHHEFDFAQLGVRVPTVIVSPLIRRNVIDHTNYDHTSFLKTLERLFGLGNLTRRDAAANDFLHLFSLPTARKDCPVTLPDPAFSGFVCDDDEAARMRREAAELRAEPSDDAPMPPATWGFLQVAARRLMVEMPISERRARRAMKQRYRAIRTPAEARAFMRDARVYIRREKTRRRELRRMARGQGPSEREGGPKATA